MQTASDTGGNMRTAHPNVKRRNCQNLKTYKNPKGLLSKKNLRCYDG